MCTHGVFEKEWKLLSLLLVFCIISSTLAQGNMNTPASVTLCIYLLVHIYCLGVEATSRSATGRLSRRKGKSRELSLTEEESSTSFSESSSSTDESSESFSESSSSVDKSSKSFSESSSSVVEAISQPTVNKVTTNSPAVNKVTTSQPTVDKDSLSRSTVSRHSLSRSAVSRHSLSRLAVEEDSLSRLTVEEDSSSRSAGEEEQLPVAWLWRRTA